MSIKDSVELEKAQVSLPPPGGTSRWALLGGESIIGDIPMPDKRQQAAIYYEMYRQHPVVRAAIDKKAQYASAGGFRFKPVTPATEINDRKVRILERFFRRSSAQQLIRLTYKDLDIYGESFWLIVRSVSETRTPMKAMRLNPRYMTPVVRGGMVVRWKYGPTTGTELATTYDDEIILHFKLDDPENDVQGISPLHPLQRAVAQDIFAMEYNESFFKNSAQTGTIFIVKTANEGQAERNRQWIEENYTGPQNAHRPLLIEGDVDVEKSVSTPAEMEFLQGRMLLRQEIAMCLEVDLENLASTRTPTVPYQGQSMTRSSLNQYGRDRSYLRKRLITNSSWISSVGQMSSSTTTTATQDALRNKQTLMTRISSLVVSQSTTSEKGLALHLSRVGMSVSS